ncbi:hypothetical protein ES703_59741 [subsurface metagenome]
MGGLSPRVSLQVQKAVPLLPFLFCVCLDGLELEGYNFLHGSTQCNRTHSVSASSIEQVISSAQPVVSTHSTVLSVTQSGSINLYSKSKVPASGAHPAIEGLPLKTSSVSYSNRCSHEERKYETKFRHSLCDHPSDHRHSIVLNNERQPSRPLHRLPFWSQRS